MNKLRLTLIKNLLLVNITKIILLTIIICNIYIIENYKFKPNYEKTDFLKEVRVGGDWIYIGQKVQGNELVYTIESFNREQNKIGNKIITETASGYEILNGTILITSLLTIVILFIANWINSGSPIRYARAYKNTIELNITCELENEVYYYFIEGRLIVKSNNSIRLDSIHYKLEDKGIDRISKIKTLPLFKTKTSNRNDKIKQILS